LPEFLTVAEFLEREKKGKAVEQMLMEKKMEL
jgi:hypothetical protein